MKTGPTSGSLVGDFVAIIGEHFSPLSSSDEEGGRSTGSGGSGKSIFDKTSNPSSSSSAGEHVA